MARNQQTAASGSAIRNDPLGNDMPSGGGFWGNIMRRARINRIPSTQVATAGPPLGGQG